MKRSVVFTEEQLARSVLAMQTALKGIGLGGLSGEATQKLIEAIGLIAHDELQNTLELMQRKQAE